MQDRKIKLLFGLIYLKLNDCNWILRIIGIELASFKMDSYTGSWDFKLFRISILKSTVDNIFDLYEKIYFLNIYVAKLNIENKLGELYKKLICKKFHKYNTYIILHSGIGENALLFLHFKEYLAKFKISKPIIIADKKSIEDCFNLFKINIPIKTFTDPRGMFLDTVSILGNKKFITPLNFHYYRNTETKIAKNNYHYYTALKEHLELHSKPTIPKLYLNNSMIENIAVHVLKDNFVILLPEAFSIQKCSLKFWQLLIKELKANDIKIFHSTNILMPFVNDELSIFFNQKELIQLAQHAKYIIGVRSGFLEVISSFSKCPTIAIYNKFNTHLKNQLTSKAILEGFSLNKLELNNNVTEFDYQNYTDKHLVNKIMKIILKENNKRKRLN